MFVNSFKEADPNKLKYEGLFTTNIIYDISFTLRYVEYLCLQKLCPDNFLVPCYDMDIVWHTHQEHNYRICTKIINSVFIEAAGRGLKHKKYKHVCSDNSEKAFQQLEA